jgi:hypothetical protein
MTLRAVIAGATTGATEATSLAPEGGLTNRHT